MTEMETVSKIIEEYFLELSEDDIALRPPSSDFMDPRMLRKVHSICMMANVCNNESSEAQDPEKNLSPIIYQAIAEAFAQYHYAELATSKYLLVRNMAKYGRRN